VFHLPLKAIHVPLALFAVTETRQVIPEHPTPPGPLYVLLSPRYGTGALLSPVAALPCAYSRVFGDSAQAGIVCRHAEDNARVDDERTPWAKRRCEQRKRDAALRYDLEMESRKVGLREPHHPFGFG